MGFKKLIKDYLIIIIIPLSTIILYYTFLYSGLFLILDSFSNVFSELITKKKDIPFTIFDSIIADYCTTAIFFILISSVCLYKYRNAKKMFIGFLLSTVIMIIVLMKYLLLLG